MNIEQNVTQYIIDNFLLGDASGLTSTESLLQTGLVDSTGILEIVTFLEESYELSIADEEMVPENLDSIANIVLFVQRKNQALGRN